MSNLLKILFELKTAKLLVRLARGLRLRPHEQGGRSMNSHDSIAPTKVGNPRTEAAAGRGRDWSLRDLFLSLVYGLLFGSLAFLTGCLEGGQFAGSESRYPKWSTQDFEDEELKYLDALSLKDRLQFPFSQDKPPTEWATSSA